MHFPWLSVGVGKKGPSAERCYDVLHDDVEDGLITVLGIPECDGKFLAGTQVMRMAVNNGERHER
jgi:hypothetical protein